MGVVDTLRDVVAVLVENYATLIAGSIAYSAFVSILPVLTLAFVVATVVGEQQFVTRVLQLSDAYFTPTARRLFVDAARSSNGRVGASVFSVVLLVWSALRVFRNVDTAFSLFYGSLTRNGPLDTVRDGLLILGTLGVATLISVGISVVTAVFRPLPLGGALALPLLVVGLVVAFLPMYYVFPDVDVTVGEVLPGVAVAAVGWAVLQGGFQVYVDYAGHYTVYGTIGGVLLVLTWLYVAGLLLLVGVAVNVVLGGRRPRARVGTPSGQTTR